MENLNILYIEDDDALRFCVSRFLSKRYKNIITAFDLESGLDKFRNENPDVIITDLELPGGSGIKIVREVKNIAPDKPVIVTTAYPDQAGVILDIDHVLMKPFNLEDLHLLIKSCF